jgi:cytochrome P450
MTVPPAMQRARACQIAETFDLRELPYDFYADPYPVYAQLLETEPVKHMPDGSVFLTRHADLCAVYRDARVYSSDKQVEFAPKYGTPSMLYQHHTSSLVFNDPPRHTRVRRLIMGALTRRAIAELEPALTVLVDRLLDTIGKHGGGDLIGDFASAIPVEVIGNLLGVPQADRAPLRGWSLAILGALEPRLSPQQEALGNRSVAEFTAYLKDLVAERRRLPGDPEHDVLTRLIQGDNTDSPDGGLLEPELLHNCVFILNAGHETTTNLIGNALVALHEWPRQRQMLLANLHASRGNATQSDALLDLALEEFLRFESSNQLGNRRCLLASKLAGVELPAGTLLTLCIGAANRDPSVFERPQTLDLRRSPNRHLAFGSGIHQCAGMSLARLEGRVAIGRFLLRFADYVLSAPPQRGRRARFRGFLSAPFAV